MAIYLLFFIAVLVIGALSIRWERRWNAHRTAAVEEGAAAAEPIARPRTQSVANGFANLWAKLTLREQPPLLVDRFRAWSNEALASDAAVCAWLNSLTEPAYTAFVEHVAEFSAEMGFALADLVDGRMAQLPGVAQSATQILLNYCRANRHAALAQREFDGYRAFAAYLADPTKADSQRFVQQLYAKLVEQQVTPAPTPERLALSEQERLLQMQDAIRQAGEKPEAFGVVLNAVVAERQRTAADVTVAAIVQQAMAKVIKPGAAPATAPASAAQATDQSAEQHKEEVG